jgi:hypothetical protein
MMDSLESQLAALNTLEDGWDSYNAPPPNKLAIYNCALTLQLIKIYPLINKHPLSPVAIIADAEGGVAMCWSENNKQVHITFTNKGSAIWLANTIVINEPILAEEFKPLVPEIELYLEKTMEFLQ